MRPSFPEYIKKFRIFCFVCGMIGHSERDCAVVYANPEKEIARAYDVWPWALLRNVKNQNVGARCLRSGVEGSSTFQKITVFLIKKRLSRGGGN